MKHSGKIAALVFATVIILGSCGESAENNNTSKTEEKNSAAVSDTSEDEYTLYPVIVNTKDEAKDKLSKGMWMYMDGTRYRKSPEEYVPHADKDAWYYGAYLDLKEDGNGLLNLGGYDSTIKYVINDDLTIDITHGNPEVIDQFMLGSDEEYGEILYSTEDENIRFYHELFENNQHEH